MPIRNKTDQEVAGAINRAIFHRQALAYLRVMNARRNAKGALTAITNQNVQSEMAMRYRAMIITAARTVHKDLVDVEENKTWERVMIHAVGLVRYMRKVPQGLKKMKVQFQAENEGVIIPTQEWWLTNPSAITVRRRNRELSASLVVFVVKCSKVAKGLVKRSIKAVGVWFRVDTYTNLGPDIT